MIRKIFVFGFVLISLTGCTSETNWARTTPPANTKVVVVEFSDFNCPACRAAAETVNKIKTLPNLYFNFRHFPLPISGHESSPAAANAFECARDQNFEEKMEAALFANSGKLDQDLFLNIPVDYSFGENFDQAQFKKCVTKNEFSNLVQNDLNFAQANGLNSTPSFFVNGLKTSRTDLLKTIAAAFEEQNANSPE